MKLLTINTHSLQEEPPQEKLEQLTEFLLQERPDLVAMQEVNQTRTAPPLDAQGREGYFPTPNAGIPLRRDNYAANAARLLRAAGVPCSWAWLPVKRGYGKYDEGLALLSLSAPIIRSESHLISRLDKYENWCTRKILGVQLKGCLDWFYSVHMGWWDDEEEPFRLQWENLEACLAEKKAQGPVWLLGDFNAPAGGESCRLIRSTGWQDSYALSAEKDDGITVKNAIDGWRESPEFRDGMRIDYIWCSQAAEVKASQTVFNGKSGAIISDHFGVMIETGATRASI